MIAVSSPAKISVWTDLRAMTETRCSDTRLACPRPVAGGRAEATGPDGPNVMTAIQ